MTVIGGGFIGVEVASGLAALGLRPTILEMGERLWAGSLGDELDAWARERLAGAGIEVRLGATVTRLEEGAGWVGEERIDHAFSVAGIGVVPRTELAEAAGLTVDDGIVTDLEHRTSHASTWAAGDVARVEGRRIEHWHAAREGGERAALSMLGQAVPAQRAPWVFSEVAGELLDVVGWSPAWDETVVLGESAAQAGSRLPTWPMARSASSPSSTARSRSRRREPSSSGTRPQPSCESSTSSGYRRPGKEARPDAGKQQHEGQSPERQDRADQPVVGPACHRSFTAPGSRRW